MDRYTEIKRSIADAPTTMITALMIDVVKQVATRQVFQPGKLVETVQRVEVECTQGQIPKRETPDPARLTCNNCFSQYDLTTNDIHRKCGLNGCNGRLHKIG